MIFEPALATGTVYALTVLYALSRHPFRLYKTLYVVVETIVGVDVTFAVVVDDRYVDGVHVKEPAGGE